jgi:hypothetical protein
VLTGAKRDQTSMLGILPDYVHSLGGGAVMVGLAVGAPALTGADHGDRERHRTFVQSGW